MSLAQEGERFLLGIAVDLDNCMASFFRGENEVVPRLDAIECPPPEIRLEKPRPVKLVNEGGAILLPHKLSCVSFSGLVDHTNKIFQAPD